MTIQKQREQNGRKQGKRTGGVEVDVRNNVMFVMNSFVTNIFERFTTEGAQLFDMKDPNTLRSCEAQTAFHVVLPRDPAKQAIPYCIKSSCNQIVRISGAESCRVDW
jgi:hypothetical protein